MSKKFGAQAAHMLFGKIDDMLERVAFGIEKARDYLFTQQHEDGYWCGELEADTTLESDYIAIHTLLGTGDPEPDAARNTGDYSPPECRWGLAHLRWRPFQHQRVSKSLFCAEADGL